MNNFVHLHLHSQYSLLDGAVSLEELFKQLKNKEMDSVALTDHGVMYGIIPFFRMAKKAKVHPVLGCEFYVAPGSHTDKKGRNDENPYHLVLLAENNQGYQNLLELASIANTTGFYYKPRIDKDLLYRHRQGLIGLSACLSGEIPQLILQGQHDQAWTALKDYLQILGQDNFFLEIQDHNLDDEKKVNSCLEDMASKEGIGLVATNDVHYLDKGDAEIHDVLLCIQTGKTLEEEDRLKFPNDLFYLRTPQEMEELFQNNLEAVKRTKDIAERCQVEIDFDKFCLPDYPLPQGERDEELLKKLCLEGLNKLSEVTPEIEERLEYELKIIIQMGFASYFLIVRDFIVFARQEGIAVGPGRGSVAGSLVAYLMGITGVNPLEYGLIFERFLNPERVTMPDIDIDFCFERRDEVIHYVQEKYGKERVAQILTFGTMAARGAIRDVGRVLGLPYGDVDKIAKEVPSSPGISLENALEEAPGLKKMYQEDPSARRLIELARRLEGAPRHTSTHAAGVVITPEKLTNYTPLQKTKEEITTQYGMEELESIGLLKFDFLALRTLTVIDHACKLIKERTGRDLDMAKIPMEDKETYDLLKTGHTQGIFQMESDLYKGLTREYQPETFEDIIAIIALGRPGPMGSDRLGDFIQCRHGRKKVEYPHPILEPILKETYGIILYQEQVMKIASQIGGFSMGEADILRRGMGKKKGGLFQQYKEKFLQEAVKNGLEKPKAEEIFNLMEFFGRYGFNKSHSAAYALISYQTAYLKAHFPLEFMAALLNSVKGLTEKVAQYIDECKEMGIKVLPPDVNECGFDFTIRESSIRFGLAAIKNVGRGAIETIIMAREERPFVSLLDFCQRVDLSKINIRVLESLIRGGAMDSLGLKRAQMMSILGLTYKRAQESRKARAQGQRSLLELMEGGDEFYQDVNVPEIEEFAKTQLLKMERETLGFYISGHPLDSYGESLRLKGAIDTVQLRELSDQEHAVFGGIINKVTTYQTRKGQPMAFVTLEDWYGQVETICFPDVYEKTRDILLDDEAVLVKGKVDRQDEEQIKVIVSELSLLYEPLQLELSLDQLETAHLTELKKTLSAVPSEVPVHIRICRGEEHLTLVPGKEYWAPKDEEAQKEVLKSMEQLFQNLKVDQSQEEYDEGKGY